MANLFASLSQPATLKYSKLFLAFDPGGTTGVAVGYHQGKDDFTLVESSTVQWNSRVLVYDIIRRYNDLSERLIVVSEDFKLTKGGAQRMIGRHMQSSEVLGIIDLACYHMDLTNKRVDPAIKASVIILPKHTKAVGTIEHRKDAYQILRYAILEDVRRRK